MQVAFYKRAQIFAADVYGAFGGRSLGAFRDIDALTMFADYRVPVVLRRLRVLRYSDALAQQVRARFLQYLPGCHATGRAGRLSGREYAGP